MGARLFPHQWVCLRVRDLGRQILSSFTTEATVHADTLKRKVLHAGRNVSIAALATHHKNLRQRAHREHDGA
jgi:hypothetical protein